MMTNHIKPPILLLFLGFFSVLSAQETVYYNHNLTDYQHAEKLYHEHLYVAAKKAFTDVKPQFEAFTELKTNCDYYIAGCAIKMNEQGANKLMEQFINNHPNALKKNDAIYETALYHYNNGNYSNALKWFADIDQYSLSPSVKEDYKFAYGYTLFKTNQIEASKPYFKSLLYSHKYSLKAKYYYGYIAYQADEYQEAEQYLEDVSKDATYNKDVSYYLADMSFKSGQFQKAIDQALPLLKTARANELSEINKIIGESYFNLKQYDKAIGYLKAYKGKNGKWNNTDYYQLGYCYYQKNDYNKAIEQFNQIIDGQDTVTQNAYYHLAECYLNLDKKTEALNAFKNASQMPFNSQIKQDAYLNYAKLSYDIGNPYKPVPEVLQDYLKAYPDTPEKAGIKRQIISSYELAQDYKGGMQYLEKEGLNHNNEIYQKMAFYSGVKQFNNHNYKDAIKDFETSLSNKVSADYAQKTTFWMADAYYQTRDYNKAEQLFNQLQAQSQNTTVDELKDLDYQLGYVNFKQQNYKQAVQRFEHYIAHPTANTEKYNDAYLRLADMYYATSNYQKAYDTYQDIPKLTPKQADYATFQSAVSIGFVGLTSKKIQLLNDIPSNYPTSAYLDDALYVLGTTYTSDNQPDKAIASYDRLLKTLPQSPLAPRALLKKGLIYYNNNQERKALKTFKQAVALYPNSPIAKEAVQNARRIYISIGEVDAYADWINTLDHINVTDNEIEQDMYESANQFYIKGDYRKSADGFTKFLKEFPNSTHRIEAHFYLAESLNNQQKPQKATEHYQYVADASNNQFTEQALVQLTNYQLKQSEWQKAMPYLQKLETLATHDQNVLFAQSNLMKAYYQSNQYTKAEQYADKCLKNALADAKVKSDAQLIIARSAVKNGNINKAKMTYEALLPMAQGDVKAEALYYDAYFKHQDGDYKNSNVVVQKIASEYAGYKYWGAKALIVMANNFYALNDAYQATYILDNVIQNFKQYQDIISEAQTELSRIKAEQAKTNNSVKS